MSYNIYKNITVNKDLTIDVVYQCSNIRDTKDNSMVEFTDKNLKIKEDKIKSKEDVKLFFVLASVNNGDVFRLRSWKELQNLAFKFASENEELFAKTIHIVDLIKPFKKWLKSFKIEKFHLKDNEGYYVVKINKKTYARTMELSKAKIFSNLEVFPDIFSKKLLAV